MTEPKPHPAPFSDSVLGAIIDLVEEEALRNQVRGLRILDPFAGIGKIHELQQFGHRTVGLEIEEEWAMQHPSTICTDLFRYRPRKKFDALITSPCYGNRMADHHNARDGSHRRTYKHYLGRDVSENSAGAMAWGEQYRDFHRAFIFRSMQWVNPGGLYVINMKNHRKTVDGEVVEMKVSEWWLTAMTMLEGMYLHSVVPIATPGYRFGSNSESRAEHEFLLVCRTP
jgi:hypothetical protein